ncbi:MAG: hypothetical protein K8L99_33115 [Anaerolineae bacterium]|nr:hypothetical protein [Anaerolineae bacterium]
MPITVNFDTPDKKVIFWKFDGPWSVEDWYACTRRALELRATVNDIPVVPAIFDLSSSGRVPSGMLPHARVAMEMMDQRDYVILAHPSGVVRSLTFMYRLLNPSMADKVLLADTVADAHRMIGERKEQTDNSTT